MKYTLHKIYYQKKNYKKLINNQQFKKLFVCLFIFRTFICRPSHIQLLYSKGAISGGHPDFSVQIWNLKLKVIEAINSKIRDGPVSHILNFLSAITLSKVVKTPFIRLF